MSKITSDEKIKAVESYIQGELGLGEVRKKYGVPKTTFFQWVRKYTQQSNTVRIKRVF